MKKYLALLLILPNWVIADYLNQDMEQNAYQGPDKSGVELMEVSETSPYGSDRPLSAKIKNNTGMYLDRLAIKCTITDQRGYRVFKDIVFKSKPSFSVRIAFPPISTPELGIPPGAIADIGLYTDDNRWTRGHGDYKYDCDTHGVSGQN